MKARRHEGTKAQGTKAQRHEGTKARRHKGTKAQGTKAQRHKGTKAQRHKGTKAQRHANKQSNNDKPWTLIVISINSPERAGREIMEVNFSPHSSF